MSKFIAVQPEEFQVSPFKLIGKDWMLIAAEKGGRTNAMTASWGGLGVMWKRNVAFIVIRPHRFTKEFVDAAPTFSLNFFDESHRNDLNYFGSTSGRDEDKIAKTNFTVVHSELTRTPYFEEANTSIICCKLYSMPYREDHFIDRTIDGECYPNKDYHTLYVGEVLRILRKQ